MRTEVSLGVIGAARASWLGEGYRSVIRELREKHPRADISRLARLLEDRVEKSPELLRQALEYVVANTVRSLEKAEARTKAPAALAATKSQIDTAAAAITSQVLVLNMEMPNGKRLRYCDGNYVAQLGGALAKAGRKAGKKLMGQVFDEKSLRAAMGLGK